MPRDPRTYLWDARRAAERVTTFVERRSFDDYVADAGGRHRTGSNHSSGVSPNCSMMRQSADR
jgi:hypothetical protein